MVIAMWMMKLLTPRLRTLRQTRLCRRSAERVEVEGLEAGEIEDGDEKGDNLTQNGRDCRTAHTHIKDKDEDGVKDGVDDGTEQHGDHGEFRTAVRTNHSVECG